MQSKNAENGRLRFFICEKERAERAHLIEYILGCYLRLPKEHNQAKQERKAEAYTDAHPRLVMKIENYNDTGFPKVMAIRKPQNTCWVFMAIIVWISPKS